MSQEGPSTSTRGSSTAKTVIVAATAVSLGLSSLVINAVRSKFHSRTASSSSSQAASPKHRLRRSMSDLRVIARGGKGPVSWDALARSLSQSLQLITPPNSVLLAFVIAANPQSRLKSVHWLIRDGAPSASTSSLDCEDLASLETQLGLTPRDLNGPGVGVPSSERALLQKSLLDSALGLAGMDEYADWNLAAGLGASRAITIPLVSLGHRLGSLHVLLRESECTATQAQAAPCDPTASPLKLVDHPSLMTMAESLSLALLAMDSALAAGPKIKEPVVNVFATAATEAGPAPQAAPQVYTRLRRNLSKQDSANEFCAQDEHVSDVDTPIAVHAIKTTRKVHAEAADPPSSSSAAPNMAFPLYMDQGQALDTVHEDVTMLVADVHDWEALSEAHPKEAAEALKTLFKRFRDAGECYGVEQAEMLGDCYVAMGNLFKRDPNHARTMLRLGVELLRSAHDLQVGGVPLQVRVGVSTGAFKGGVVGRVRPQYVVVGADVSVASRLEQTARLGTLHFSESSLKAAKCRTNARGLTERLIRVCGVRSGGAYEYRRTYTCKGDDLEAILTF